MSLLLYGSGPSPYVRKIRVQAHEAGIDLPVQIVQTSPTQSDPDLIQRNPLGKIPALQLGTATSATRLVLVRWCLFLLFLSLWVLLEGNFL